MKGDFSRSSFDPQKHYQSVRMQQGRMQLDADWNEQADILLHLIRTQLNDFLGPGATAATEPGFAITLVEPADQAKAGQPQEPAASAKTLPDFQIGAGRYYVEGMLCENEASVPFSRQPDYPDGPVELQKGIDADYVLIYLDVWQRHITAVQDPAIREIALGGPDTTTRVKTVWQVKLLPLSGDPGGEQVWCDRGDMRSLADWQAFTGQAADKGQLRAKWEKEKGALLENHLYRVEIHSVAGGQVTFKWSRENGAVVFPIRKRRKEASTCQDATEAVERDLIGFLKEGLALDWADSATISRPGDSETIHIKKEGDWVTVALDVKEFEAFTWEDVPGTGSVHLIRFLKERVALQWAEGATITKSDGGKTILIEKDGHSVKITLDEGQRTATLTTSDGKPWHLEVKEDNGKRKLYRLDPQVVSGEIELHLEGLDRDPYQLQEGFWVELCDDVTVLSGRSLPLCKVEELDRPNARITLKAEKDEINQIVDEIGERELQRPLLRRWEGAAGAQDKPWLTLENGIEVAFDPNGTYRVGDYWLIPARTRSTDGIEWPQKDGEPLPQAPHGIAHRYAPLALLQFQEGRWSVLPGDSTAFRSLPRITADLSATGGQLDVVFSRLDKVQETVDTLVGQTHVFAIVKSEKPLEKGDLVSLDPAALERMSADDRRAEFPVKLACAKEQDVHLVLGVVTEPMDDHRYRIALYGRVCCKVKGPVKPGDLLVPSPEPGHAERCRWFHWMRTIIGKALSSTALDKGKRTGTLDMLVTPNYRFAGSRKRVAIGIGAVALILVLSVMGLLLRYFKTFRLNIYYSFGGFVTKNPDKASYSHEDKVTLTAVSDPNYTFGAWSGDLSGIKNRVTLVMDGHKSVTANFGIYSLTASSVCGSVTRDPNQASYLDGAKVALTAWPDPNYTFHRWSGDLSGSNNPAALIMDADKSVTAYFLTTNSIGMKLVYIPAGSFIMGSPPNEPGRRNDEEPQHQVTISKGFWMGQTEVTQGQYFEVTRDKPWLEESKLKLNVQDANDNPAVYVSWADANDFCRKLSQQEGVTYRLPTEAEWEYACRAGTTTPFSFGNDDSSLVDYAWFSQNTKDVNEPYAHPVGQKKPNPWGLYDMHGNVWEWCSDWYDAQYYGVSPKDDPKGPTSGNSWHCLRGGSWGADDLTLRCSFRHYIYSRDPAYFDCYVGFRVIRSQP